MAVRWLPSQNQVDRAAADVKALQERFDEAIVATLVDRGEPAVLLARESLLDVLVALRDDMGYQLLRSVTAVDFLDSDPRYQVVYHLTALPDSIVHGEVDAEADDPVRLVRLKVPVSANDALVPSAVGVYPTADWHEREVFDMFGIEFSEHPDLCRILLPESFDGHPLRKDFPLQYEDVAFSHNSAEVARSKPRATS